MDGQMETPNGDGVPHRVHARIESPRLAREAPRLCLDARRNRERRAWAVAQLLFKVQVPQDKLWVHLVRPRCNRVATKRCRGDRSECMSAFPDARSITGRPSGVLRSAASAALMCSVWSTPLRAPPPRRALHHRPALGRSSGAHAGKRRPEIFGQIPDRFGQVTGWHSAQ